MESDLGLIFAIVAVLVCLLATIFAFLIYSGLLTDIDIRAGKPPFENLTIAYKFARGPYKNAGALFTEVSCLVPQLRCIGLYYDDPSEVVSTELRYVIGAIISEGEDDVDNDEYETLLIEKGYKLAKLPAVTYALNTTFPFKNTLSIFLAVGRVYPKLSAYIRERNLCAHPMIEVYDDGIIHFMAPLSKQDEFYVSEAKEERSGEEKAEEDDMLSERRRSGEEESPMGEKDLGQGTRIKESKAKSSKEGSNGSGEESTGSSFEELEVDQ